MQKILVARPIFPDVIERLKQHFDVDWNNGDALPADELARRLADKDGALTAGDPIGAATLAAAPRLRVVSNMAVGYNNFDMAAFNAANVLGTNTPDVLNETTADFGWALMMAAARRIAESGQWLRAGRWEKWSFDSFLGADVHGSTLGVIGMGRIGQALARRARGFNMQVVYHNRSRVAPAIEAELNAQYLSKEDLLRRADHVVLVLPYTAENHHTIGAAELALMKPTATLTNIARGGIVDDAALAAALRERRIAAAGLDVFEGEPKVHPDLLTVPNVVLTPHIASASDATRRAMANLAADNLIAGLGVGPRAGRPPNPINPDVIGKARS
ncbi:2-hydroxyacid dehydrogenase [Paraburkholderia caballeronis]|uniref:Lactate dehydrogenase n=1 Tax=Paraburkholderia caballeronis TaxID=416943 RepID=A0A1H7MK06_9BURK|nr:D-glycerate dehydrogenase [Paraburkholderia caballeronis]PXW26568.1 lactate dehydrogenase-like 2-hydroxyacid dehydrogenase [Paraburkholderia caballeronis]PXX02115.1 lactate dehydrogenase-like 2-hydroxyacid dehydrogenase [Paraburkholderia caballeronis]RAK01272.1 lactate dehydrogenase-like 2-hydroxyacid dehydrogenase [Paraburkholderia caballeronis]TDV16163.1 lactate dehydrogenase-like 2-hydroxyacid dehydrogenase [Paraburkholderia caballeronis]TDV20513.1 lactate dehydrogenase-like 2-hydroxyaci